MTEVKYMAYSSKRGVLNVESINMKDKLASCYYKLGDYIPLFYDGENAECALVLFTGLFDKNGVEIYEGSIMREPDGDFQSNIEYEVVYHLDGFYLKNTHFNTVIINWRLSDYSERLIVTGNAYES